MALEKADDIHDVMVGPRGLEGSLGQTFTPPLCRILGGGAAAKPQSHPALRTCLCACALCVTWPPRVPCASRVPPCVPPSVCPCACIPMCPVSVRPRVWLPVCPRLCVHMGLPVCPCLCSRVSRRAEPTICGDPEGRGCTAPAAMVDVQSAAPRTALPGRAAGWAAGQPSWAGQSWRWTGRQLPGVVGGCWQVMEGR